MEMEIDHLLEFYGTIGIIPFDKPYFKYLGRLSELSPWITDQDRKQLIKVWGYKDGYYTISENKLCEISHLLYK